jgi:hypothetical protein
MPGKGLPVRDGRVGRRKKVFPDSLESLFHRLVLPDARRHAMPCRTSVIDQRCARQSEHRSVLGPWVSRFIPSLMVNRGSTPRRPLPTAQTGRSAEDRDGVGSASSSQNLRVRLLPESQLYRLPSLCLAARTIFSPYWRASFRRAARRAPASATRALATVSAWAL